MGQPIKEKKTPSKTPAGLEAEYRDALADWAQRRGVSVTALLDELREEHSVKSWNAAKLREIIVAEWRSSTPPHKHGLGEDKPGSSSSALKDALGAVKGMKKQKNS